MRSFACAVLLSGCGSGLWLVQPRPEVTYQEVTRTSAVQVTTNPPGATLLVDGAEAGVTPRDVAVTHKVVRRQRRQSPWLPLVGTLVDAAAFGFATLFAANSDFPGTAITLGAAGAGVVALDLYLITGRNVVNEGIDTVPAPVELTVRMPGFADETRKVRVPDITRVQFDLTKATRETRSDPPPADR